MNVGWKALTDDQRNTWLEMADANGIFESSRFGFNVGFYDVDGDDVKDENEAIYFFKEISRGGNVYVLSITPKPGANGAFQIELKEKKSDGVLVDLPPSSLEDSQWAALKSRNWTLTAESLNELNKTLTAWVNQETSMVPPPLLVSIDTNLWSGGDRYLGWEGSGPGIFEDYTVTERDARTGREIKRVLQRWILDPSQDYKSQEQGDPSKNTANGSIAGWGGWVRFLAVGRGGLLYHQLSAYEAYEIALSKQSYSPDSAFGNPAIQGSAVRSGITIGLVTVNINNKQTQTMGFSKALDGYTYTFYWDPVNKCNRIGKVVDSEGLDITSKVLALQTTTDFGKSWTEIASKLVPVTGIGAALGIYGNNFYPVNNSGSVEVPTKSEEAAFNAFKKDPRWASYFDGDGRLTTLPSDAAEKSELLKALMDLNPADILKLFTSSSYVDGLDLLMKLLNAVAVTEKQASTVSEWLGKLMFLTGRGLAKTAGKNGHKKTADFWTQLHGKLRTCVTSLSNTLLEQGFGLKATEKVLFNFMLGLRNYTKRDGPVSRSMLTPEETLLFFIEKVAAAGAMGASDYSRDNANAVLTCTKDVVYMLGMLMGLRSLKFGENINDRNASSVAIISVATQEALQKLLALGFGSLVSYAANSTAAQDAFVNAQKSSHEDSRKLQDAMASLYTKYWEAVSELIKQMARN